MKKLIIFGLVILCLVMGVSATLDTDLVSYYKFDGNASDAVGSNDFTATLATQQTGIINQGYQTLNTSIDYVIGNYNAFKYTASDTFSFQLWYKYIADGYFLGSIKNTGVYSLEYITMGCFGGSCTLGLEGSVGSTSINTDLGAIDDGNWHHIVLVFDGANAHTNSNVYVDSIAKNPDYTGITGDINKNGDYGKIVIGSIEETYTAFDGSQINDEFAIWSKALTQTEVTQLYNSGSGLQYPFSRNFTITAQDVYNGTSINNFSVEIDGYKNFSTTTGTITTDINTSQIYDITFWNITNYLNRTYTNYNTSTNLNGEIYPYTKIYAQSALSGTYLDNFTITYDGTDYLTISGTVELPLYNETAELTISNVYNNSLQYTDKTVNVSVSPYLQNYTFEVYPNPSILDINIYNGKNGSLLTESTLVQVIGTTKATSLTTTTGNAYFNNLTSGIYTVRFISDNFTSGDYVQTIGVNSYHTFNAYLFANATYEVTFTTKNQNSGEIIEGATYLMSTIVNNTSQPIGIKVTNIAGQVKFAYELDKIYTFSVTKSGFNSKSFLLGPNMNSEYTVWLTPSIQYNITDPYSRININILINKYLATNGINYISAGFQENMTNNVSVTISAPTGDLISYGFNVTYKTKTNSSSGTNSIGETMEKGISIGSPQILDTVVLKYYYTSSLSGYHEFTKVYSISQTPTAGLFTSLRTQHYGMGMLERVLIVMLIAGAFGGLITLFNGQVAGGFATVFIFGYFLFTGFIEIWFVALPIALIFIFAVRQD